MSSLKSLKCLSLYSLQQPSATCTPSHHLCQQILKDQDFLSDKGFTKHHHPPVKASPLYPNIHAFIKHEYKAWSPPFLSTRSAKAPRPSLKGNY